MIAEHPASRKIKPFYVTSDTFYVEGNNTEERIAIVESNQYQMADHECH